MLSKWAKNFVIVLKNMIAGHKITQPKWLTKMFGKLAEVVVV